MWEHSKPIQSFCMVAVLAGTLAAGSIRAQEPVSTSKQSQIDPKHPGLDDGTSPGQDSQEPSVSTDKNSALPDAPTPSGNSANAIAPGQQVASQSKRILWVIPNYRAVSNSSYLPPLRLKQKIWLATEDTFDYSDFIFVGALAGISMSQKSEPSFGQGAAGYGRYSWRVFADTGIENYMAEALVPAVTREDPRYYTLGKGGFFKRTGYAVSRLFVTRTDAGNESFNFSELVGSGAAAGIGNAYYPTDANLFVKTYQRWGTQVGLDGVFNVLKEFWPDIDQKLFHGKY